MKNLLLIAITILAVGCGGKDESTTDAKPVEEKVLEVKEEVKAKESVAEAKPESKSVSTDAKPVEEKVLEVKEEVKAKESVAEAKPESKSVSTDEMEIREGIGYVRGSDVPHTGKVYKLYESGQKELELNVKDGKYDGLVVWWHQNGQKKSEENWKEGKMIYEKFWNSKGESVDTKEEAK